MNRATRDKVVSATNADLTSGNACWETPPLIFEDIDNEFHFHVDLTADATRALCKPWFGPGSMWATDALTADWVRYGRRGFSNPPYGRFIPKILKKAEEEAQRGFVSALLIPMRVTKAFHKHVLGGASELRFASKRITFFEDGAPRINLKIWKEKGKLVADSAVFDSILVVYRPRFATRFAPSLQVRPWLVPKHVTAQDLERARARLTP